VARRLPRVLDVPRSSSARRRLHGVVPTPMGQASDQRHAPPPRPSPAPVPISNWSSRESLAPPGTIAVTGSPSPSTRWIRSRRSHFDVRLGSVEMMISSKSPSRSASRTDSKGSDPPTSQSFDVSSRGSLQQRPCALKCPVGGLAVADVRDQEGELARPVIGAASDRIQQTVRSCRPGRHDKDTRAAGGRHRLLPSLAEPADQRSHLPRYNTSSPRIVPEPRPRSRGRECRFARKAELGRLSGAVTALCQWDVRPRATSIASASSGAVPL